MATRIDDYNSTSVFSIISDSGVFIAYNVFELYTVTARNVNS